MAYPFTAGRKKAPPDKTLLARKVRLVTSYDVPLLGSSSKNGKDVYIDRSLAAHGPLDIKGVMFDTLPALVIHEKVEKALEDLGWSYTDAHNYATKLEHAYVRSKGIKPEDYEEALKPWIVKCGRKTDTRTAPNMELKPYQHPHSKYQRKLLAEADAAEKESAP
jgi:hypothetical protein